MTKCHLKQVTGFEDWFRVNDTEERIFLIEDIFEVLEADKILEGEKCRKNVGLQLEGWGWG